MPPKRVSQRLNACAISMDCVVVLCVKPLSCQQSILIVFTFNTNQYWVGLIVFLQLHPVGFNKPKWDTQAPFWLEKGTHFLRTRIRALCLSLCTHTNGLNTNHTHTYATAHIHITTSNNPCKAKIRMAYQTKDQKCGVKLLKHIFDIIIHAALRSDLRLRVGSLIDWRCTHN